MKPKQKREQREINGIVLLDKPIHISSNGAMKQVKAIFRAAKAGHTGSLDVLASGMLPVCLGQATRYAGYLLNADKTYTVEAKLGIKTVSGDIDSDIISEKEVPNISEDEFKKLLLGFTGELEQIPPMHSALKKDGKPLYKLARKGIEIERKPRKINIYKLELLDFNLANASFKILVSCSKGTYIRSLVMDIGDEIGCGAHVTVLHRDSVYDYKSEDMVSIEELDTMSLEEKDKHILSPETMLTMYPVHNISEFELEQLRNGIQFELGDIGITGPIRLRLDGKYFAGLAKISDTGRLTPVCVLKQIDKA